MLFLAESSAALKRLEAIPSTAWIRIGIAVAALIVLVVVLRKAARTNKIIMGVIVLLALTFVGFSWIYKRNEPAWATPVVEALAPFFPSQPKR